METIPKINRAFDTRYEEAIARTPRPGAGQRDSGAGGPGAGLGCEGAGAAPAIPLLIGWKEILPAVGNISVYTARRWARSRGLPIGYVGRTPVADQQAIEAWIESAFFAKAQQNSYFGGEIDVCGWGGSSGGLEGAQRSCSRNENEL